MNLKAVLFDLDGTLLPMDQDLFVKSYFKGLAAKLASHGYESQKLLKVIWDGTGAMIKNDGSCRNEEIFWKIFLGAYGEDAEKERDFIEEFYKVEFQDVKKVCGFTPKAAELIHKLKKAGYRVILATNPLFPPVATESRVRWAGLKPEDFEFITTYDNSSYCKPNPKYYREILKRQRLKPEECMMVGNDVDEDMIAGELGMQVFLLTDCLINRKEKDISVYPNGGFEELLKYLAL